MGRRRQLLLLDCGRVAKAHPTGTEYALLRKRHSYSEVIEFRHLVALLNRFPLIGLPRPPRTRPQSIVSDFRAYRSIQSLQLPQVTVRRPLKPGAGRAASWNERDRRYSSPSGRSLCSSSLWHADCRMVSTGFQGLISRRRCCRRATCYLLLRSAVGTKVN